MSEHDPRPTLSDTHMLLLEADVLNTVAQSPDIAETEAERFHLRAERAKSKVPFVEVRLGLAIGRTGLELPYPENGEMFEDYYDRMRSMADEYDKGLEE